MEHRDVSGQEEQNQTETNMAEAAVESPVIRFYCHQCLRQINPVLPEYTCPECQSGFVEEVAQERVEPSEESDNEDVDPEDIDDFGQINELYNMLHFLRPGSDQARPTTENIPLAVQARYARPGPSRRSRFARIRSQRASQNADDTVRNRVETDHSQVDRRRNLTTFMHHLVNTLSENTGVVANASFPVFLNLHSNPGDYAWGRGGWNAIITQLINQLDGTGPPPLSKEKINEIPTVNICQEQVDKNLQCTVCMEDFVKDEAVRQLTCDHHFHNGCITPWLELHGTCPICRKLLNDSSSQENMFHSDMMDSSDSDLPRRPPNPTSSSSSSYNPNTVYEFNDDYD